MKEAIDPILVGDELRAGVREELWRRKSERRGGLESAEKELGNAGFLAAAIATVAGLGAAVWAAIGNLFQ